MNKRTYSEKIDRPFMDLPQEARPTYSPWDMRLAFNTLSPGSHRHYVRLMNEIFNNHMAIYNNPEAAKDTSHLYGLATAAGLDTIATELVRNWGVTDPEGRHRVTSCDSLRSWPDINSPARHSLQIWLAHKKPTTVFFVLPVGPRESLYIKDGHHTVMSNDGHTFKPGDWMAGLLVEYARLRQWRNEFGDDTHAAPKPATTLLPRTAGAALP